MMHLSTLIVVATGLLITGCVRPLCGLPSHLGNGPVRSTQPRRNAVCNPSAEVKRLQADV